MLPPANLVPLRPNFYDSSDMHAESDRRGNPSQQNRTLVKSRATDAGTNKVLPCGGISVYDLLSLADKMPLDTKVAL